MAGYVGVAPGTTTIQTEDGRIIQLVDWVDDKHWGTAELQSGDTSDISVFSAAGSQPIPGGTRPLFKVDSNIPRTGDNGLPQSWEFYVYSLGSEFMRASRTSGTNSNPQLTDYSDPLTLTTFFDLDRKLYISYKYNGKIFTEGLTRDYPGGAGPTVAGTATNLQLVNNGMPSPRDRAAMVLPIWEREGIGYVLTLTPVVALTIAQPASDSGLALNFVDDRWKKSGLIKRQVT
jgi:hypothetical protein